MAKNFIVSIFSKDRVGIISDVTNSILKIGGDLGDLNQAVLHGYFTMILIAEFENEIPEEKLKKAIIEEFGDECDEMSVVVKGLIDDYKYQNDYLINEDDKYVMTVSANDRKGLVAEVSKFCKENQINIIFLSTQLSEDKYIMMYLIDLSAIEYLDVLRKKIKEFADEKKLEIVLQHNDIFKATNEIKYYK